MQIPAILDVSFNRGETPPFIHLLVDHDQLFHRLIILSRRRLHPIVSPAAKGPAVSRPQARGAWRLTTMHDKTLPLTGLAYPAQASPGTAASIADSSRMALVERLEDLSRRAACWLETGIMQ